MPAALTEVKLYLLYDEYVIDDTDSCHGDALLLTKGSGAKECEE